MSKLFTAWAVIALLAGFLAYKIMTPRNAAPNEKFSLSSVQIYIENQFETVDHITADDLSVMNPEDVIVFDTRLTAEYAVSHIENAVHVDPNISAAEFKQLYEQQAAGKTAVFYCSVGMRSSILAERVASGIDAPVYNLRGGIFGWHNEQRPLVSADGVSATDAVHPYDKTWGQLVARQDKLSYD